MSLLEDIFLQDEADEAQQLERVIEGDEYDERPRSRSVSPGSDENVIGEDEAEEEKRRVDPSSNKTKRVTKNPRFILNPARLTGPRGIQIIPDHFKDFKFKGKGNEKEDLDMVLKKLEHWAYRLYPKFQFEDCLKKIETLGKKRPVMVHLQKIRTDQFISEDTVVQKDSSDDETPAAPQEEDEFDKLLQQQIELARATPAPGSVKKTIETPRQDRSPFTMPKATSSPSISDEQKERMIRNRKLAEERRLARLKQNSIDSSEKQNSTHSISEIIELNEEIVESNVAAKKNNRSNVIDSSDDECDVTLANEAVTVDVHMDRKDTHDSDTVKGIEKVALIIDSSKDVIEINDNINEAVDKSDGLVAAGDNDVEIIDLVDKGVDKNIEELHHIDKNINKSIGINEPVAIVNLDETGTANKDTNKSTQKIVVDSSELSTNVQKVIDLVDLDCDSETKISEAVITVVDNSSPRQCKSLKNNDLVQKENIGIVVQDMTEEIRTDHSEDKMQNDFQSTKEVCNLDHVNSNIGAEITQDIMDVDFSDDF